MHQRSIATSVLLRPLYDGRVRVVVVTSGVIFVLAAAAAADPLKLTYGADIGVGMMRESNLSGVGSTSDRYAAAAFGADVGATVTPTLAVTLRLLALRGGDAHSGERDFDHVSSTFLGPRLEFRPHPRIQLAAGFGAGAFDEPRRLGYAVDVYIGMTAWEQGPNSVCVALETTPTFIPESEARDSRDLLNVALLVAFRRR